MTHTEIGQYKYLIVDDDAFSCELMANVLAQLGAKHIFSAQDGASARQLAQQHQPDFILLDVYMPDQDGWDFLKQVREFLPKVSVLMITGSMLPADFTKSMDLRADGYCIKPVLPDVLLKALGKAKRR